MLSQRYVIFSNQKNVCRFFLKKQMWLLNINVVFVENYGRCKKNNHNNCRDFTNTNIGHIVKSGIM